MLTQKAASALAKIDQEEGLRTLRMLHTTSKDFWFNCSSVALYCCSAIFAI